MLNYTRVLIFFGFLILVTFISYTSCGGGIQIRDSIDCDDPRNRYHRECRTPSYRYRGGYFPRYRYYRWRGK